MTPAELSAIEARARAAQNGRWPTSPVGLCRTMRRSSASRVFVSHARADVLALAVALRRAWSSGGGA